MKNLTAILSMTAAVGLSVFAGCVNADGRFRPPDPLGRALFDALDPAPRQTYVASDADYVRGGPGDVWIEAAWGRDARGQRVWIPGHYARAEFR